MGPFLNTLFVLQPHQTDLIKIIGSGCLLHDRHGTDFCIYMHNFDQSQKTHVNYLHSQKLRNLPEVIHEKTMGTGFEVSLLRTDHIN